MNGFYWFESILPFIYWSQIRSIGHKSFKGLTIGHESDDESRPTFIGHPPCRSFQAAWKRTTIVTIKIVYQWLSKTKHIDRGTQAWVSRLESLAETGIIPVVKKILIVHWAWKACRSSPYQQTKHSYKVHLHFIFT